MKLANKSQNTSLQNVFIDSFGIPSPLVDITPEPKTPHMSDRHTAPLKTIDMHNMQVVHCGKLWDQPCSPSCRCMAAFLEHNESVVSWLQPRGGTVEQQVPSIRLPRGLFCHMSLRMMKAIWRLSARSAQIVSTSPSPPLSLYLFPRSLGVW